MSFLSYTQKFVSNHDYISHVLGFWKNIYVILKLIAACLQKTLEKTLRKCRSCTACHPGASENMHVQLIWRQFAPGWEFKPGQDREAEFTQGQFFFQFLSCKHWNWFDHTQGWVQPGAKLTPERNFSCKQAHSLYLFSWEKVLLHIFKNNKRAWDDIVVCKTF